MLRPLIKQGTTEAPVPFPHRPESHRSFVLTVASSQRSFDGGLPDVARNRLVGVLAGGLAKVGGRHRPGELFIGVGDIQGPQENRILATCIRGSPQLAKAIVDECLWASDGAIAPSEAEELPLEVPFSLYANIDDGPPRLAILAEGPFGALASLFEVAGWDAWEFVPQTFAWYTRALSME